MEDRTHKALSDEDIKKITTVYHAWRSEAFETTYEDQPGFCKSVKSDEMRDKDYILTPGHYIDVEDEVDDGIPFADKMNKLTKLLSTQLNQTDILKIELLNNIKELGYEL